MGSDELSARGLLLLAIILVLLSAILVALVLHILVKRRQLRLQEHDAQARSNAANEENGEFLSMRIQRRYETIEGWMISKYVLSHDDFCQSCVHSFAKQVAGPLDDTSACSSSSGEKSNVSKGLVDDLESSVPSQTSSSTASTNECPICLDEFRAGQIISYSPNPECCHVFHHECIKEWLLRHTNCPFCRNFCMHTDLVGGKQQNEVLSEYLRMHSQRSATTLFCEKSGLLSVPSNVNCTVEEFEELISRIRGSVVDRMTLATSRQSKPETTGSRKSDPASHRSNEPVGDDVSSRERALSASLEESEGPLEVLDVDDDPANLPPQGANDVPISEHLSLGLQTTSATYSSDSTLLDLPSVEISEKSTVELSSSEEF
mmetsp:Transcript_15759/g.43479  ORF Transcript_15759/g.43479 Transcript_15759/m.43479 type:complete len:375 (+) Transcript_15759:142-1266(+)